MKYMSQSDIDRMKENERNIGSFIFRKDRSYAVKDKAGKSDPEVIGKVVTIRKFLDDNMAWVQLDRDVFKVSLNDLIRKTVKDRYSVNMGDIISSELFKDLTVIPLKESLEGLSNRMGSIFKGPMNFLKEALENDSFKDEDSVLRIIYKTLKNDVPCFVEFYISSVCFIFESTRSSVAIQQVDMESIPKAFSIHTGKNFWNLLKTLVYTETVECTCGCNHFKIIESIPMGFVCLECEECEFIYFRSEDVEFEVAEDSIQRVYDMNSEIGR